MIYRGDSSQSVDMLGMSIKTTRTLKEAGVKTINNLELLTMNDLVRLFMETSNPWACAIEVRDVLGECPEPELQILTDSLGISVVYEWPAHGVGEVKTLLMEYDNCHMIMAEHVYFSGFFHAYKAHPTLGMMSIGPDPMEGY